MLSNVTPYVHRNVSRDMNSILPSLNSHVPHRCLAWLASFCGVDSSQESLSFAKPGTGERSRSKEEEESEEDGQRSSRRREEEGFISRRDSAMRLTRSGTLYRNRKFSDIEQYGVLWI